MTNKTITLVTGVSKENELITQDYAYPIFVKGALVKKAIDLGVKLNKSVDGINSGFIDELADFAVELYGKQFKRDELIDGIDATELIKKLTEVLGMVMGGAEDSGNAAPSLTEVRKN